MENNEGLTGIQVKDLNVTIGGVPLLRSLSFDLRAGEFLAVVGRSGSGKTLLTRAVDRLLPAGSISTGSISVDGLELSSLDDRAMDAVRGRRVAMLFQQPKRVLNSRMSVRSHLIEAMGLPPLAAHWKRKALDSRIAEMLDDVGLSDKDDVAGMLPGQLSGGMAQRVMLAIALAADPGYILADEPTSSLDPILKSEVMALLRRKQRERDLGVLFITHDIASIERSADRIIVINEGMIVEEGTRQELFASAQHPVTRELLHAAEVPVRARLREHKSVIVEAQGVSRSFGRRRRRIALYPTNVALEEGEILGVLGRSGSGKSTFARILANLDIPSTGTVTRGDGQGSSTRVTLIAQEPYSSFDPTLTLRESLSAAVSGLSRDAADERIREAVTQVGLPWELLKRLPARCSGGQLQRMAIARALLVDPQVLICDESTSALDSVAQRHILDLLLELNEVMGLALIVISHDLDVIRYVSDRVAVFYEGEVVEDRPLAEFLSTPKHPYSKRLVALSKDSGTEV